MDQSSYYYLKLQKHELTVPYLNKKRRVRVLLPKDYHKDTDQDYPVVYFHDGQNVFHSSEAYSGHSWKTIPTIKDNPELPKMILVGIDNDGENRMNEYTPWQITESPLPGDIKLGGKGREYSVFVMDVVKPFIDAHYRTKSDKKHTAMIGSSLGGNISSYMGIQYKEEIGRLGIFSLANWITNKAFNEYLESSEVDKDQLVYIQVGTQEGDDTDRALMYGNMKQAYIDCSLNYAKNLLRKGIPVDHIDLNVFADERHTEAAWAKHLLECLQFISQDW